jgi:4-hydroxymandelate oxidase
MRTNNLINLDDYEQAARGQLDHMACEYLVSGVADDLTLGWNRKGFERLNLMPRVLVDVSAIDTRRTLFGREHDYPLLLAPAGYHCLFHPDGEHETVRGANSCRTTLVASCFSTVSYRSMSEESIEPLWFQLYMQPDRAHTRDLLDEVIDAGCEAICVTVDLPVNSPRDRERRVDFSIPKGLSRANLIRFGEISVSRSELYNSVRAPGITWKDIEWLRSYLTIPLLLKGVIRREDARAAVAAGCDGIIVSNHGGRSIDGVPATIDLLPEIVEAVGSTATIIMDGGIRRGTDVLKAIALGADAVMIGRPYLYGLAVSGAQGLAAVVDILRLEISMAMGLMGCPTLAAIDQSLVRYSSA